MADTGKLRILSVDDNDDVLELIRTTLQEQYDVMTLSNPVDLYEIMDLFEPDLLILDIMMPRITGYQLIEILRKNPNTKDLPIMVLSARAQQSEIKHGYRLGATLYLPKPFQPDRLVRNIETQFRMHPPANRTKALTLEQLQDQIEQKPAYRKGMVHLTGVSPRDRHANFIDIRKKMQERILQKEKG